MSYAFNNFCENLVNSSNPRYCGPTITPIQQPPPQFYTFNQPNLEPVKPFTFSTSHTPNPTIQNSPFTIQNSPFTIQNSPFSSK